MKRTVALALIVVMITSLSACTRLSDLLDREPENQSEEVPPTEDESEILQEESTAEETEVATEEIFEEASSAPTVAEDKGKATEVSLSDNANSMVEFLVESFYSYSEEEVEFKTADMTDDGKTSFLYDMINHGLYAMKIKDYVNIGHEDGGTYVDKTVMDNLLSQIMDCDFSQVNPNGDYIFTKDNKYHILNADGAVGYGADILKAYEYEDNTVEIYASIMDYYAHEFSSCYMPPQLAVIHAVKDSNDWGLKVTGVTYEGDNLLGMQFGTTSSFYSDKYGDYKGENLFDKDNNTTWVPGGDEQWCRGDHNHQHRSDQTYICASDCKRIF